MKNSSVGVLFVAFALATLAAFGILVYLFATQNSSTSTTKSYIHPSCQIFCSGPLLHIVQTAGLFNDSKEFVDRPLKHSSQQVLNAFDDLPDYSKDTLLKFIDEHFLPAGADVEDVEPVDFQEYPKTLQEATNTTKYYDWAMALNKIWKSLIRQPVVEDESRTTLLPSNHPIVIPGGRFRESFYWDSYWIIQGLLKCEMTETAKGVVSNFLDSVKTRGIIPNGGRAYFLTRSQPPLLAEMLSALHDAGAISDIYLEEALPVLEMEYDFWMKERIVQVNGYHLNQYTGGSDATARPESYVEDIETSANGLINSTETFVDLRAGAESGWDYSSRWFHSVSGNIKDIDTRNVIPVELNVILLRYERFLKRKFSGISESKSSMYAQFATKREEAFEKVFWSESEFMWRDWLIRENRRSHSLAVSNFIPLWAGLGSRYPDEILNSLNDSGLVRVGGVATTSQETGQQWDGDNAWPPLQDIIVEGLMKLNTDRSKDWAVIIVKAWLESNYEGWKNDGHMYEKYFASHPGQAGGGGEYGVVLGFGWTNGVVLKMLVEFQNYLKTI